MAEVEVKLREGMARQGITGPAADEIVHQITSFALYGFPECVAGETRVLDAETGKRIRIDDVVNGRVPLRYTLACDKDLRLQRRRVIRTIVSGIRKVYRLRTALGREIVATAEHPILTMSGWRAAIGRRATGSGSTRRRCSGTPSSATCPSAYPSGAPQARPRWPRR